MLLGLMSLMAMSLAVLTPVFARKILGGGADTQGFLTASSCAGVLVGALYLASRAACSDWVAYGSGLRLWRIGNDRLLLLRMLWLSLGLMFVTGMATMVLRLQQHTAADNRGRRQAAAAWHGSTRWPLSACAIRQPTRGNARRPLQRAVRGADRRHGVHPRRHPLRDPAPLVTGTRATDLRARAGILQPSRRAGGVSPLIFSVFERPNEFK